MSLAPTAATAATASVAASTDWRSSRPHAPTAPMAPPTPNPQGPPAARLPPGRLIVRVRHPIELISRGAVSVLSREIDVDASEWDDRTAIDGLLLADHDTAIRLALDRRAGRTVLQGARLIAIGTAGREAEVRTALAAGVEGYLLGDCGVAELVACVRAVAAGARYLSHSVVGSVADSLAHDALTPRETTVLQHLWEGLSNKAIARRLDIGLGTVKGHVRSILDKLEAVNRTQAVKIAVARGLVNETAPARHPVVAGPPPCGTSAPLSHGLAPHGQQLYLGR